MTFVVFVFTADVGGKIVRRLRLYLALFKNFQFCYIENEDTKSLLSH